MGEWGSFVGGDFDGSLVVGTAFGFLLLSRTSASGSGGSTCLGASYGFVAHGVGSLGFWVYRSNLSIHGIWWNANG